ncbi:uncharacterized protein LOC111919130 [Lactuca sativa]|uniref:uncharacterized protein LOC111919130 n=1 Tax=Lactuca sativa TaxID=4236 RepID=UPI000CD89E5E|nr:uncharacterized protein LOC111919130 [Lactuca sativa]
MPKYAKFLKELLTNRKKMEEVSNVVLNENFSATMLKKLPKKMGDPGSLTLPCRFVLDMEEDHQVPIILGRPFLNTASAIVDIRESKLTLRVGEESVTFGVDQAMKHSKYSDNTKFSLDTLEELME